MATAPASIGVPMSREHRDPVMHQRIDVHLIERRGTDSVVRHSCDTILTGTPAVSTPAAQTRRGPEPPDISERGGMKDGQPQRSDVRLFMQFMAFGGCPDVRPLAAALAESDVGGRAVRGRQRSARHRAPHLRSGSGLFRRSRAAARQQRAVRGARAETRVHDARAHVFAWATNRISSMS